jgi:hypothetical protein
MLITEKSKKVFSEKTIPFETNVKIVEQRYNHVAYLE